MLNSKNLHDMKKFFTLLLWFSTLMQMHAAVADTTLVQFDLNHYQDWIYHRPETELTRQFIQQGRVNLFTMDGGWVCTLESPPFLCQEVDSVKVDVVYRVHAGTGTDGSYNTTKVTLQIDLLDESENVVATSKLQVQKNMPEADQDLTTMMAIPQSGDYSLIFSAPKADGDNCGAIMKVKVWAVSGSSTTYAKGDVNGDGTVDIADVNALINVLVGKEDAAKYDGRAYINDDLVVDISDVNSLINLLLGAQ